MAGIVAERERLQPVVGMLNSVPCLVDQPAEGDQESSQVTIQAAALQLIPALVYGHTLEQIAQRRGLARTLREIAVLRNGGLVRLESAPADPTAGAQRTRAATAPAPGPAAAEQNATRQAAPNTAHTEQDARRQTAPSPAPEQDTSRRPAPPRINLPPPIRPLRPVPSEARPAAQPPRRPGWWQTPSGSAAAPATVELPRPRLVTDETRPHLEAVRKEHDQPEGGRSEPRRLEADHSEPTLTPSRSWRSALTGFFFSEPSAQV
jgi:hypothetical protein